MIKSLIPALALWAGVATAEDVAFFNGDLTLTLPEGLSVGRAFGEDTEAGIYAVDLAAPSIETLWTEAGRAAELPDMDRMEAAFGLTFPSLDCADYPANAPVLPTRCKQATGMSILVIPKSAGDSGAQLGNQMGLLAADVDTLWNDAAFDEMLTTFCDNATHAHRTEVSRDPNSVTCISDRPALAPHFLSFRLLIDETYAIVMYAQNIRAETDVIMTYGVDNFLALINSATNIEPTLLAQSEAYVTANGRAATYLLDVLADVSP